MSSTKASSTTRSLSNRLSRPKSPATNARLLRGDPAEPTHLRGPSRMIDPRSIPANRCGFTPSYSIRTLPSHAMASPHAGTASDYDPAEGSPGDQRILATSPEGVAAVRAASHSCSRKPLCSTAPGSAFHLSDQVHAFGCCHPLRAPDLPMSRRSSLDDDVHWRHLFDRSSSLP